MREEAGSKPNGWSANAHVSAENVQVYIVGAFVDKNRHKGMTKRKADGQGIATARLPINEFVPMTGCTVLTTLHGAYGSRGCTEGVACPQ